MAEKIGRNDLCPCGSGKKYKSCCINKTQPHGKKKFTAKLLSAPKSVDLMERTFGAMISKIEEDKSSPKATEGHAGE